MVCVPSRRIIPYSGNCRSIEGDVLKCKPSFGGQEKRDGGNGGHALVVHLFLEDVIADLEGTCPCQTGWAIRRCRRQNGRTAMAAVDIQPTQELPRGILNVLQLNRPFSLHICISFFRICSNVCLASWQGKCGVPVMLCKRILPLLSQTLSFHVAPLTLAGFWMNVLFRSCHQGRQKFSGYKHLR